MKLKGAIILILIIFISEQGLSSFAQCSCPGDGLCQHASCNCACAKEITDIDIVLEFNNKVFIMKKDEQKELRVRFTPGNPRDKTIKWSVSDTSLAKIDKTGKLTAIKKGIVTVTAMSSNGKKSSVDVYIGLLPKGDMM